ncbi:MAG: hypothetical protein AMXMBFR8_26930 [Nevskiales bacterium]
MAAANTRVRLTPEGIAETVAALKKAQAQAQRASQRAAGGLTAIGNAARSLRSAVAGLGLTLTAASFGALTKRALNTADAMGKTAQRVGTTSETFSVLSFAAQTADASQEQLLAGSAQLARQLQGLAQGAAKPVAAFARLKLTAEDLAGLDTGQAFALIAERIAKLPDGLNKTQIAIELFGRSGAQLIPLLNDLGTKGFAVAREEAERFGLVVTDDMTAAAAAANDAMTLIGLQAQGLANQFALGLAPTIAAVMGDFTAATAGDGVEAMAEFGRAVGRSLRNVIGFFQVAGRTIGAELAVIAERLRTHLIEFPRAFFQGNEARTKILEASNARVAAIRREFDADLDALAAERAASEAREQKIIDDLRRRRQERQANQGAGAVGDDPAAARRRQSEADRARRDAARARQEELRRQEAALRALAEIERETLEASGRTREAQLAALDEEIAKRRQVLEEAGRLNAQTLAALAELRNVKAAGIDFEDISARGQRAFDELARARQRIEQDVELGIQTELGGQQRILAIERERLPVLQQLAAAALAAAQATGNPELIANAEALTGQVEQLAVSVAVAGNELAEFVDKAAQAATGDLTAFFSDGIAAADSLGDAFRDLASAIVESLQRIAAEIISKKIIASLLSAFGGAPATGATGGVVERRAGGGLIRGPGTPTSDSVPAWLSTGEYVVRAKAVAQPGMLQTLQAINGMRLEPLELPSMRFAEGGLVAPQARPASARIEGGVQIGLGPGLVAEEILTPEATRNLLKVVQKNPRAFRAALGV